MSGTSNKKAILPLLAAIGATGPFAIDAYLPAMPDIAAAYAVDFQLMESSVSTYLIGLASGFLIGAPVSDRLGRRPTILAGLLVFAICSALIALSPNAPTFLALRVGQAFGGGFAVVNMNAIVRDLFDERDSAHAFTLLALIAIVTPLLAPAVGSILLALLGWQSIFFAQTLFAVTLIVLVLGRLPETRLQLAVSDERTGVAREIGQNLVRIFSDRRAVGLVLCLALSFSCMFVFLSEASFAYMEYFSVTPPVFAGLFAANMVTLVVFNRVNVRLLQLMSPASILPIGVAIQVTATMALCGYVASASPILPVTVVLIMLSIGSIGLIGPNAMATYMAQFSRGTGAASGIIGSAQFITGGTVGILVAIFHDGSLFSMAATMFACSMLAGLSLFMLVRRHAPATGKTG